MSRASASGGRVPPPTKLPRLITTPLSWLYRVGINHRNRAFDNGKGVTKLDRPVISVGNLSTGGTGKTPMVHLVVKQLQALGHQPVIAMRGYGAKPGEKGDEQLEHELALPGVPIVAQPDRLAGLRSMFATDDAERLDCVVLDDGFQHRKLARDLDIVLIDASRPPDRDALLPSGHLREPIDSLARAGLILLTHAERVDDEQVDRLRALVARSNAHAPVLGARHTWSGFVQFTRTDSGWDEQPIELESIQQFELRIVCGIGNADAFVGMLQDHALQHTQLLCFRDHEALSNSTIQRLNQSDNPGGQSPILMTRKDWVKASRNQSWVRGSRVILPVLSIDLGDDEQVLNQAIEGVFTPPRS